jgi:hypothetical protein
VRIYEPKVLGISGVAGFILGALPGFLVALATGGTLVTGLASGVIVTGGFAAVIGLFAALEPPTGWSSTNKRKGYDDLGRRSLLTRIAFEFDAIDTITSTDLLVWAAVVGGGLIALGVAVYTLGE